MLPPVLKGAGAGMSVEEIYEMFPNLAERRHSQGTRLSGGEQQMLAVARILRTGARLLLLDEISEGLAPVIVQALARMITMLRGKGYTVVMVEQNFRFAAPLADHFHVIEHGHVALSFPASELAAQQAALDELLILAPADDSSDAHALAEAVGARVETMSGPADAPAALARLLD